MYLYVNSTNQDVQTKYLKLFLLKIFLVATGVNNTGAPCAANISAIFRKKIKMTVMDSQGL
jgi:hypothetical protein